MKHNVIFNGTIDNVRVPRARSASEASEWDFRGFRSKTRNRLSVSMDETIERDYNKGLVRIGG